MKKLSAIAAALVLVATLSTPAVAEPADKVSQVTLSSFSATASSLNNTQRLAIKRTVDRNPSVQRFTCTGLYMERASRTEVNRARARAKAACDHAKRINPKLSTVFEVKSTKARGSAGRVILTLRSAGGSPSAIFAYRFSAAGELERRGNLDSRWGTASVDKLKPGSTRAKAFAAIKSAASGTTSATVSYQVGSNVPKDMESAYRRQMDQALAYFDFTGLRTPLDILIYTEKDRTLMTSYWESRVAGDENIQRKNSSLDGYVAFPIDLSVGGSADVRHGKDGSYPTIGIDFQVGSRHTAPTHLLAEHVAHEMVHVWQWHAMGTPEKVASGVNFQVMSLLPCHAIEGAANTFGAAIGVKHADWYAEASDVIIRRTAQETGITRMTNALALSLLEKSESYETCSEGYAIGMVAYEWLVANYGAKAYFDLFTKAGEQKMFADSILEITGLTKSEFYQKAAPHITATFNRALLKKDR